MANKDTFLPLTLKEVNDNNLTIGWDYIRKNKSRWIKIDLEFSSIDFALMANATFIYKDIMYEVVRQYLVINDDGSSTRLIVGQPSTNKADNPDITTVTEKIPDSLKPKRITKLPNGSVVDRYVEPGEDEDDDGSDETEVNESDESNETEVNEDGPSGS